jgi:hypothetical protein
LVVDLYEIDRDRLGVRSGSRPLDVVDRAVHDSRGCEAGHRGINVRCAENQNVQTLESRQRIGHASRGLSDAGHQLIQGLCRRLQRDEGGV